MQISLAERLVSDVNSAACEDSLQQALADAAIAIGFDHFALAYDRHAYAADHANLLVHDYPDTWASVYVGFDLSGADPVRRAGERSMTGFAWRDLDRYIPLTRGDRQMLAVGRECGIGDGYTIPRHLPGLAKGTCTFAVCPDKRLPGRLLAHAEVIGTLALNCALGLDPARKAQKPPALSDRQRECLLWVARGKTAAETAIILGITTETVVQHLKKARERYQVHCKQSLVVAALFDGLIGFADIFRWRDPG
jgi:DNA-binding CsgD family transcriptional regulator